MSPAFRFFPLGQATQAYVSATVSTLLARALTYSLTSHVVLHQASAVFAEATRFAGNSWLDLSYSITTLTPLIFGHTESVGVASLPGRKELLGHATHAWLASM
jgi:hypothetical protein